MAIGSRTTSPDADVKWRCATSPAARTTTMASPRGDHPGARPVAREMTPGGPPSVPMIQSFISPPSGAAYTSRRLSGDQLTESTTLAFTSSRGVPPSAAASQIPRRPPRLEMKASCRPSGDTAGRRLSSEPSSRHGSLPCEIDRSDPTMTTASGTDENAIARRADRRLAVARAGDPDYLGASSGIDRESDQPTFAASCETPEISTGTCEVGLRCNLPAPFVTRHSGDPSSGRHQILSPSPE